MNAILVSHNGLGDNLFMIGALKYLCKFYEKIYFICKSKYVSNVTLFFIDEPKIECVQINELSEFHEIKNIIEHIRINSNFDIFICGSHKRYVSGRITKTFEPVLENKYIIDYDTITENIYSFIEHFYLDIGLNLTYFFEYFSLPSTQKSVDLYNSIKDYYIIFIQLTSSDKKQLNISNLVSKWINVPNAILVCNDLNLYDQQLYPEKYNLAQTFVYEKIIYYNDTIINSDEIYIVDSCFTGIVLPYVKTGKLKAKVVRIIRRDLCDQILL
jgi:hypothetical protein